MRLVAKFSKMNRREALRAACGLTLGACASLLALARPATAKTPKDAVAYQDEPKDGKTCAECRWFQPADGDGPGACKLVEGEISARGWCGLWAEA